MQPDRAQARANDGVRGAPALDVKKSRAESLHALLVLQLLLESLIKMHAADTTFERTEEILILGT
jgi:hypothetical protein